MLPVLNANVTWKYIILSDGDKKLFSNYASCHTVNTIITCEAGENNKYSLQNIFGSRGNSL